MSGWNPPPGQGGPPYGGGPGGPGGPGSPGGPGGPPPGGPGPYGQQPGGPYGQQPGGPYGPQPGGPYGQPGYGGPPPGGPYPPPRRKSSAGLVIGIVGGALALIVLAVIVVVVLAAAGGKEYEITAAETAGGWERDTSAESRFGSTASTLRSSLQRASKGEITNVVTAFYKDPAGTSVLGTSSGVLFLGGTGDINDPDEFVEGFRREVSSSSAAIVTNVEPGANGGKAACGQISASGTSTAVCMWATDSSFGAIVPVSTSSKTTSQVAGLMRQMRDDLETEK